MPEGLHGHNHSHDAMTLFTKTAHCIARAHCGMCREREGGRKFRESLAKIFELPDGEVDFACPQGLPWRNAPQRKPCPPFVLVRKATCGACDIADTCALWHGTACQRMALWRRPGMSCPADRWGPAIGQLAAQ